ncbi:MAG: hypothetical protein ACXW00_02085, partial [Methylobacter sp.]
LESRHAVGLALFFGKIAGSFAIFGDQNFQPVILFKTATVIAFVLTVVPKRMILFSEPRNEQRVDLYRMSVHLPGRQGIFKLRDWF